MTRQSITLTMPNDDWLKNQLQSKEYSSKSEVVNDLIRKARAKQGEISPLDSHLRLADVYSELGEYKKARAHVDDALKLDANYSLKSVQRSHNQFKDPNHLDRIINSLRKAGLPEHS